MEIKLNDNEIRKALAEALANKIDYSISEINPENCWFEAQAGSVDGEIDDIHDVKFCTKVDT